MARGQDGFATPFLYDSFIHYFTPVYPGETACPTIRQRLGALAFRVCRSPATILGMAPLAVGAGSGAQLLQPLAIAGQGRSLTAIILILEV